MAEAQQKETPVVNLPSVSAWENPDKLSQQLASMIEKRLTGVEADDIQAFMKKEENLQLLLIYHLASTEVGQQGWNDKFNQGLKQNVKNKKDEIARHEKNVAERMGPEKKNAQYWLGQAKSTLKKWEKEEKYEINLRACGKVLNAILSDPAWMEQIAFSGELHHFARVVLIIDAIAKADEGALKKGLARDTTTAIALEYAKQGGKTVDAVDRAKYYLKYARQGRLNTSFNKLPLHHRRVACGWKPDHRAGTITAFEWALNNVHVPDWQYPASCWRCGYVLHNVYGDSVHGSHYYAPWEGVYTDNHMALTKYVGGVCGGLSHFGAASACANGVPALTAGEPGHCAYIVLVDGKWTPAYSLTWERGLHWIPWSNNWTYSALHLTDALYEKKSVAKTRLSNVCHILANLYQTKGEHDKALACYELSAKAQPLNYPLWKSYSAFLSKHMPNNVEAWKKLNARLCNGMCKQFPEQAAELLKQGILQGLAQSGISADDLASACALFWKHAETMGPDRWHVERFTNEQMQACKKLSGQAEETAIDLYTKVLAAAAPHDAYSGMMMAWGNNVSDSLSDEGKKKLADATISALGSGKGITPAQQAKMLGSLLLAAEKARDTETFYAITKMIDKKEIHSKVPIPDFPPFPGKLVSKGGLPFASSTSQWDLPHTHSGLLTEKGGSIHTGKDKDAWIAVKLPKHAYITGVVFAGTNEWSLIGRFRPMKIQVSDTGRDDDWHDTGASIPSTGLYMNRFDLQKERPKALYVRVLRSGGPEVFHANGIYVYGEPAA